jgi:hypothetical protein
MGNELEASKAWGSTGETLSKMNAENTKVFLWLVPNLQKIQTPIVDQIHIYVHLVYLCSIYKTTKHGHQVKSPMLSPLTHNPSSSRRIVIIGSGNHEPEPLVK